MKEHLPIPSNSEQRLILKTRELVEETPIRERQNKTPMKLKHTEHLCQNVIKAKRLVLDSCGTDH